MNKVDESGQLSLDFIIGFTIFMTTLIAVATLSSGLLIELQSKTIDLDAIAYRTSVILLEDPGEGNTPQYSYDWQLYDLKDYSQRNSVLRLGLRGHTVTPLISSSNFYMPLDSKFPHNILQDSKVNKFFSFNSSSSCGSGSNFCYPDDYNKKLIFGDIKYNFNITISGIDGVKRYTIGPQAPNQAGYIRRVARIAEPGNYSVICNVDGTSNSISAFYNSDDLFQDLSYVYWLNLDTDDIVINLTNISSSIVDLTNIEITKKWVYPSIITINDIEPTIIISNATSNPTKISGLPVRVDNSTSIRLQSGFLKKNSLQFSGTAPRDDWMRFNFTFSQNITSLPEYAYVYNGVGVTPPHLTPVIVEVWIW